MVKRNALRRLEALPAKPHHKAAGVYEWMLKHHGRIAEVLRRRSKDWAEIASEVGADGIRGANGAEPNSNSVRLTWARVCRHLAQNGPAEAPAPAPAPAPAGQRHANRSPRRNTPPPSTSVAPSSRPPTKKDPPFALRPAMNAEPGRCAADFSGANIPADETPEERIKRNRDGIMEQFRRADAWLGPPVRRRDE